MPPEMHYSRSARFLRAAGLSPPPLIPALPSPTISDFQPLLSSNRDEARSLLVQQRIEEPGYTPPEQGWRNRFSSRRREEKSNRENWVFTRHEVGKVLDKLFSYTSLAPPGVAQALLLHAPGISLDELWCHFQDAELEKRMASRFKRSRSFDFPESTWLNNVTMVDSLDYMRLICQTGVGQEVLNRAFGIALSMRSMEGMQILLSYGASASAHKDEIRKYIALDDFDLVRLLLSAPNAMSAEAWRYCLGGKRTEIFPAILLLCLHHRPDIVCGPLLLKVMESRDLSTTTMILAYADSDAVFNDVREPACRIVSRIENLEDRHAFFRMLKRSGFLQDKPLLREELMKAVRLRALPLIRTLTDAGISIDVEPNHALFWAISRMDLEMLDLFRNATLSLPISPALDFVPGSASELFVMQLVKMFAPRGLSGPPLDSHLVRAVEKRQVRLILTLIDHGASIEFDQAAAVRTAMERADFVILETLLQCKCSTSTLSRIIPVAMGLQPRSARIKAVTALVEKGILPQELGVPLQKVVSEDGDVDLQLVQLLLRYKAPVDGIGSDSENCILVATKRGMVPTLTLLCNAGPSTDTLSRAVPIALSTLRTSGYGVAFDMIKILLSKGACGIPIHRTLVTAAAEDYVLDIVRVLIEHGADANYDNGAAFKVALIKSDLKLLDTLCKGHSPDSASVESGLCTAIDPQYYSLPALELFLQSAPPSAVSLNNFWDPRKFTSNPNMSTIIPCFFKHGLDVNLQNGAVLDFAVREADVDLLETILSAHPSIASLTAAFPLAAKLDDRQIALDMMELLLTQAESVEIGQSESLLSQTLLALAGDLPGLQLLLRHRANVDFDDGIAVQTAAAAGSLEVVDLLLSSGPALSSLNKACLAAAAAPELSEAQKTSVFERLLAANEETLAIGISMLLADSVEKIPEHTQLPLLLLVRGARVEFKTMKLALEKSSLSLCLALASSIEPDGTMVETFRLVRRMKMSSDRRYWMYHCLLGRGIPSEDVSHALVTSLEAADLADLAIPKLLLEHGAALDYQDGKGLLLAIRSNLPEAAKLLSQYIVNDGLACTAFKDARKTAWVNTETRLGVYRCLLQWNIEKSDLYDALKENLQGDQSDPSIIKLLLAKGADPNKAEAECFVLAAREKRDSEFQALSKYAKLEVVLEALLMHFETESQVKLWFGLCLDAQTHEAKIEKDELLFQCLRRFPDGAGLVKLLLDHGVSASNMTSCAICPGWEAERCTALIWALISTEPTIGNDAILEILARGGNKALPEYSTPVTEVSAAFCCMLDPSRTAVLEALLEWDRDQILSYDIPGSSFGYLGVYPNTSNQSFDIPGRLDLRLASLYLGNLDAFCLVDSGDPDDGTLHLAALLALPKFVSYLLNTHDANFKEEEFDQRVPLAVVCETEPQPWAKIANEEGSFRERQEETMRLLVSHTNPKWRYRGKTVVHIALENGIETSAALIAVLNSSRNPEWYEACIYTDKEGRQYQPDEYVKEFVDCGEDQKKELISFLKEKNIHDLKANGSQVSQHTKSTPALSSGSSDTNAAAHELVANAKPTGQPERTTYPERIAIAKPLTPKHPTRTPLALGSLAQNPGRAKLVPIQKGAFPA